MPDDLPRGAALLKVCGATGRAEIAAVASGGADLVGLWHGVAGGHADLDGPLLAELATATRAAGRTPVLVTFSVDPAAITQALQDSGIGVVQLHGYQAPTVVRALKSAGATVVKVLHMAGAECQEEPLLRSYRRVGTDAFLLDAVSPRGEIGSTGHQLDPAVAQTIADAAELPFLLAGGISAGNAERFAAVRAHPLFLGVDVDSAARDADGRLTASRVAAIRRAWPRPARRDRVA